MKSFLFSPSIQRIHLKFLQRNLDKRTLTVIKTKNPLKINILRKTGIKIERRNEKRGTKRKIERIGRKENVRKGRKKKERKKKNEKEKN